MKGILFIVILGWLTLGQAFGRTPAGHPPVRPSEVRLDTNYRVVNMRLIKTEVIDGETVFHYRFNPVPAYAKILIDRRKHARMIRNVKLVYPIALYANRKLLEMERTLASMEGDRRAQERYIKQMEAELKAEYTPIIKNLTFSQGHVLIKLIDRQTGATSYELVREMRGRFTAFFWQNLGRLFGMNLKQQYDPEGEDQLLEQIVQYHEAGIL